jgi:hypothetical protein
VTPEQLPAVIQQLGLGPLRRMPRDEFEQLLEAQRQQWLDSQRQPLLAALRLTAALEGDDLVGRAEWDIYNPGSGARPMSLEPLRVALSNATWGDGRPAVLGVPPSGLGIVVWVERTGLQTLRSDWSAAGIVMLNERRYELRWPTATTTTMELDLPVALFPAANEVLITGPFPTNTPRLQRWRIRLSGRNRLDLALRSTATADPMATAEVRSRFDLQPIGCFCTYDFDLRPVRGHASSWTFLIDPRVHIMDVISTPRATWSIDRSNTNKQSHALRVTLTPPASSVRLIIQALTPPPSSGKFELPFIRAHTSIVTRETLEVRLTSDWKLNHFDAGDYRLMQSSLASDQARILTLQGHWLPHTPAHTTRTHRRPPLLDLAPAESTWVSCQELAVWEPDLPTPRLTIRLRLSVKKGSLFHFHCRWPQGYELRQFNGGEALLSSMDHQQRIVHVEWLRPLVSGQSTELEWEWVATTPLPPPGTEVPFPKFTPLSVQQRQGIFAIVASRSSGIARPGPGTEPQGWFDWIFTLPPTTAQAVFRYQSHDVQGFWQLQPKASAPTATPAIPRLTTAPASLQINSSVPTVLDACQILLPSLEGPDVFFVAVQLQRPKFLSDASPIYFPVTLAPCAQIEAIWIDGHWLSPGSYQRDHTGQWQIHVPAGSEQIVTMVIRGRGQPRRFGPWHRLDPLPLQGTIPILAASCYVRLPRGCSIVSPASSGKLPPLWATLPPDVLPPLDDNDWLLITPGRSLWYGSSSWALATAFVLFGVWFGCQLYLHFSKVIVWTTTGLVSFALIISLLLPTWWQWLLWPTTIAILIVQGLRIAGLNAIQAASSTALCLSASGLPYVFFWSTQATQAQSSTGPLTVLILPPDAQDKKEQVLVPLAFWDRLAALTTRPPVWLLSEAHYQIVEQGLTAQVEARYRVYVFDHSESAFLLPLGDSRLESARINDQVAYPTVIRPGLYSLPLPGKGRQELHVRFVTNIVGTAERELRFGSPECPQTTLSVQSMTPLRQVALPMRLGRWNRHDDSHPQHVQAELGAVRQIALRWREEGTGQSTLRIRQCCLWDVNPQGAELTVAAWLEIVSGSVTQFELLFPAELEVTQVAIRAADNSVTTPLRDWSLASSAANWRALSIKLRMPISGRWLLVAQAVPRYLPSNQPLLRFPRITLPRPVENEAFYVLRFKDIALEAIQRQGVIDFSPDVLYPSFDGIAELRLDPSQSLRVFRPIDAAEAELRPSLRLAAELHLHTHTRWQIGWSQPPPRPATASTRTQAPLIAIAEGTIHWKNASGGFLELTLPVSVNEILGPEVAQWSQHQGVVQIWLRRPLVEGSLQWVGQHQLSLSASWELPLPRPTAPAKLQEQWQISYPNELKLVWDRLRGWTPVDLPAAPMTPTTLTFTAESLLQPPLLPRLSLLPSAHAQRP